MRMDQFTEEENECLQKQFGVVKDALLQATDNLMSMVKF